MGRSAEKLELTQFQKLAIVVFGKLRLFGDQMMIGLTTKDMTLFLKQSGNFKQEVIVLDLGWMDPL